MKILISGSSGFLGSVVRRTLLSSGYDVFSLVRREPLNEKEYYFNPAQRIIDEKAFDGAEALINFSGESIYGFWTKSKKERIISSRIETTSFLSEKIIQSKNDLTFISSSAIGFYGYNNRNKIDESSTKGSGFLSDVCEMWEREALKAEESSRVVIARFGVVLGKEGGLLKKILPLTKFNFFGKIGDGRQFFSWISAEEIPFIIDFAIKNKVIRGAVNFVAPEEATNKDFSKTLSKVLGRKEIFFLPEFPLRILGGDMVKEMALGGAGVIPKKLLDSGYKFKFPNLESCLRSTLKE
ncbi:MAG: TIGR01777 family oxidoreductase [Acidobacteria bacterium]|nr:TIGR01777 family oxidoreductase [Acidobacteriota bacterium]